MDTEIFLCAEFFDVSRKDVKAIFVDETEIKAGDKLSYGLRLSRRSKLFFLFALAGIRTRWMHIISSSSRLKSTERSQYKQMELCGT